MEKRNIGLFGNYVKSTAGDNRKVIYGGRRADTGSVFSKSSTPIGSNKTQCQKCEQFGHYTYECKNPRAIKSRPTRTQQLLNPKFAPKLTPSVEIPEEFKNKKGVADKILQEKQKERELDSSNDKDEKRKKKSSSSTSSSSSESDSDSSSSGSDSESESDSDSDSEGSSDSESDRDRKTKKRDRSRDSSRSSRDVEDFKRRRRSGSE